MIDNSNEEDQERNKLKWNEKWKYNNKNKNWTNEKELKIIEQCPIRLMKEIKSAKLEWKK